MASTGDSRDNERVVRIAIVGSGLTGLAAAYFLSNELRQLCAPKEDEEEESVANGSATSPYARVQVELFERAPRLGMDASSISVVDPATQKPIRIDVPMRAFNEGYYPELITLYKRLSIPGRPSNFTFSFARAAARTASSSTSSKAVQAPAPTFIYLGSGGIKGARMPTVFRRALPDGVRRLDARRLWDGLNSTLAFLGLLIVYLVGYLNFLLIGLYHSWLGHTRDPSHALATVTLADWTRSHPLSQRFLDDILIPMLSATQTAPDTAIWDTPCAEVLEFSALCFGASTYTVGRGVQSVVRALTAQMEPGLVHLGSNIVEMRSSKTTPGTVLLKVEQREDGLDEDTALSTRELDGYHYVIFGLQANQTAKILRDYAKTLAADRTSAFDKAQLRHRQHIQETIGQLEHFPYVRSVVINHTDTRLLPPEQDRCDLNMISPPALSRRTSPVAQHDTNGNGFINTDDEDESAVDKYLQPSHANGNGTAAKEAGFDASLLAPQGCTMTTHVVKHHTRPLPTSGGVDEASHTRERLANGISPNGHPPTVNGSAPHSNGSERLANGHASDAKADTATGDEGVIVCQTTNPMAPYLPRPELVLSVSHFERVVLTLRAKMAQANFFTWARVGRREGEDDSAGEAQRRHTSRRAWLSVRPPRSQWKMRLGPLQQAALDDRDAPGLLVAGSWGPPAIPLLEGCVISARLVVSELLRREGLYSPICDELAVHAM